MFSVICIYDYLFMYSIYIYIYIFVILHVKLSPPRTYWEKFHMLEMTSPEGNDRFTVVILFAWGIILPK